MSWLYLALAGLFEVGFTTCLKLSEGFTKPVPSLLFLPMSAVSLGFLTLAARTVPLGTAYAIWTGIGAFGTAAVGILYFRDPVGWVRIALLVALVAAVVGLELTSGEPDA